MANKNKKSDKLVASNDTDTTSEREVRRVLRAMRDDGPEIEVDAQTFDIEDTNAALKDHSQSELRALVAEQETELEELRYDYEQLKGKQRGLEEELKARIEIAEDIKARSDETEARLDEAMQNLDREIEQRNDLQSKLDGSAKETRELETQSRSAEEQLDALNEKLDKEVEGRENIQQDLDDALSKIEDLTKQLLDTEKRLDESLQDFDSENNDKKSLQQRLDESVENAEHLKTELNSAEARLEEALQKIDAEVRERQDLAEKLESEAGEREILAEKLDSEVTDRKSLQQRLDESVKNAEHLKTQSDSAETRLQETLRKLESEIDGRRELSQRLDSEVSERESVAEKLESEAKERTNLQQALDDSSRKAERLQTKSDGLVSKSKELKGKLRGLESESAKKVKKIASLEKQVKKLSDQKRSSNKIEIEKAQKKLSEELRASRNEVAELKIYVDARKTEWTSLNASLQETNEQLTEKNSELESLSAELDDRNSQLVRSREQYISASDDLASQKSQVRKLRKQNRELERALNKDAKREIAELSKVVEEQTGQIAAQSHALSELQKDRDKSSSYADSLRMQLQDQTSVSKVSVAMREKLEAGLDAANTAINELTSKLETERERADQLEESNKSLQRKYDDEIRQIRFELGSAEETIAGQETIHEQLVSDLVDHRSFRQALESQLGEVEQESSESLAELNRQLEKTRRDMNDLERNLRNKDSVITELMHELSDRSDSIELKDENSNGLHKIDGFKAEGYEEQSLGDKDRVARQLIGNADGQELRFPLFKDRLTIGRTSNNDIQLNMQYISRRHAVISIDHNQTRVIDWGSKNGVFVNDTKVTEKILESGDIVTIGTTDFRYEERPKR